MAKKQKYTNEFREQAVRPVTVEKMVHAKVAADLGMSQNTLVSRLHQARVQKVAFTPKEGRDLEGRNGQLKIELRQVKIERDILRKRRRTLQRSPCETALYPKGSGA